MLFESRLRAAERSGVEFLRLVDPIQNSVADPIDVSHPSPIEKLMSRVALALDVDPFLDFPCLPFTEAEIVSFLDTLQSIIPEPETSVK